MVATIVSFQELKNFKKQKAVYGRWLEHFAELAHDDLLEALVDEHENDFPLRSSENILDQLKHKALVETLQQKAQTEFLKAFLDEINSSADVSNS